MNNEKFYEKYKYEIEELVKYECEVEYNTIEQKVKYFVACFDIKDCFYLDNLTNKYDIAKRAEKNLLSYLTINVLGIKEIDAILSITNLGDCGIVEYIAKDEFTIEDNQIVVFEEV